MSKLNVKIDACITDPPYGTTACKWDAIIPFEQMWDNLKKLIKEEGVICLFGSEPFSSLLRCSNLEMFKYDWIWYKDSFANFLNIKFQPGKVHEIISIFAKKSSTFSKKGVMNYFPVLTEGKPYSQKSGKQKTEKENSTVRSHIEQVETINEGFRYPTSILECFHKDKEKLHPTQKPVSLIEYLVKTYTKENDIVLDFTAGSGTTGLACLKNNRKCILIEKEEKYCNITMQRLIDYKNEKDSFLF
jgi:site-specific DNA-methyltransferase (adenine-specific)